MVNLERTLEEGAKLTAQVGEVIGVELTPEGARSLFEAAMGKTCSELYKTSILFACEADRCRTAQAYFAACLMIASAIETLLAMLCIMNRAQVESSREFKAWKTKKNRSFEEKVLHAHFDDYIQVAIGRAWLPPDALDPRVLRAAKEDYPLIANNLYAGGPPGQKAARAKAFIEEPAIEMLRMLQDMRNLIHGPRWPREGVQVGAADFLDDCKFVFVISHEVLGCLFETLGHLAQSGLQKVSTMRANLTNEQEASVRRFILEKVQIPSLR